MSSSYVYEQFEKLQPMKVQKPWNFKNLSAFSVNDINSSIV